MTAEAGKRVWSEIEDSIASGGGLHVTKADIEEIEAEAVAAALDALAGISWEQTPNGIIVRAGGAEMIHVCNPLDEERLERALAWAGVPHLLDIVAKAYREDTDA